VAYNLAYYDTEIFISKKVSQFQLLI
jgi:hypothetical protein